MGKKNKLKKFEDLRGFSNCFEYSTAMKGRWHSDYFKNDHPITLELACGKGEYTTGLAELFPDRNFIGVDVKGNRIWHGARYALEKGLNNVAFHRLQIGNLQEFFTRGEISEFWITFPDPQPRKSKAKKRLTHSLFLDKYRSVSSKGALLNLKTDDSAFFEFTREIAVENKLEILAETKDIYAWDQASVELLNIHTFYEKMWLEEGKKIKYLKLKL